MKHLFVFVVVILLQVGLFAQGADTVRRDSFNPMAQLGGVTVSARRPVTQVTAAGTILQVESSLASKGSNLIELLERSPGVQLDRRNNSIALNGRAGVLVLIDGRPLRLPPDQVFILLGSMNANDILRIELLDAPPAGFEAEGAGGVINIITRRSQLSRPGGSLSLTGGYGHGEKLVASVHAFQSPGNLKLYTGYIYSRDRSFSSMDIYSTQDMPVFGGRLLTTGVEEARSIQRNHHFSASAERKISRTLGLRYSGSFAATQTALRLFHSQRYLLYNDSIWDSEGRTVGRNEWRNWMHSIELMVDVTPKNRISLVIDHFRFSNDNPSLIANTPVSGNGGSITPDSALFAGEQRSAAHSSIRISSVRADFVRRSGDVDRFETGIKLAITNVNSASGIDSRLANGWVARPETINNGSMQEWIAAGYASLTRQVGERTNIVGGMRYELAGTRVESKSGSGGLFRKIRGNFFPSIQVTHKLSDNADWLMAVASRIARPAFNDLASFVRYSDPTAVYTGNTQLQATISHQLKLGLNWKKYNFALLLANDRYPIARYQLKESPLRNLLLILPQNLQWQRSVTVQAGGNRRLNSWWTVNYHASVALRKFRETYTSEPVTKAYGAISLNTTHSFQLPQQYALELSGWYNTNSYNGTVLVRGMGAVNIAARKSFEKNGDALQLSVTDAFTTVRINNAYGRLTREAFDIQNRIYIHLETSRVPIVKLSYTRPLGKVKPVQRVANEADPELRARLND